MNSPSQPVDNPSEARTAVSDYPWRRLLLSALFMVLLWLSFWAVLIIGVVQFVLRIFDTDASEDLRSFGRRLGLYMGQLAAYVAFARPDAPFPFERFPQA